MFLGHVDLEGGPSEPAELWLKRPDTEFLPGWLSCWASRGMAQPLLPTRVVMVATAALLALGHCCASLMLRVEVQKTLKAV